MALGLRMAGLWLMFDDPEQQYGISRQRRIPEGAAADNLSRYLAFQQLV
jgi:hypothetical protein